MFLLIIFVLTAEGRFHESVTRFSKENDYVNNRDPDGRHFKSKTTNEETFLSPKFVKTRGTLNTNKQHFKNVNVDNKKSKSHRSEQRRMTTFPSTEVTYRSAWNGFYLTRVTAHLKPKIIRIIANFLYSILKTIKPLCEIIEEKDIINIVRRPKFGFPKTLAKIAMIMATNNIVSKDIKQGISKVYNAMFPENVKLKEVPSFGVLSKITQEILSLIIRS